MTSNRGSSKVIRRESLPTGSLAKKQKKKKEKGQLISQFFFSNRYLVKSDPVERCSWVLKKKNLIFF
jgi:hypothetical protein